MPREDGEIKEQSITCESQSSGDSTGYNTENAASQAQRLEEARDGRGRLGAVCPKSLFQAKFQNGVSMLSRLRSKTDVSVLAIWNSGRTISRLSQFGGKR